MTDFFTQIKALLPKGYPLTVTMLDKDSQITVMVYTSTPNDEDDASELLGKIKPLSMTGTAEQLNTQFFNILNTPQTKINELLQSNQEEVLASIKKDEEKKESEKTAKKAEKIEKATKKVEKKEEPKIENAKMNIEAAAKFMKERQWASALINLELAEKIEPNNKHIKADIKTCNQWIKAKEAACIFDEEKPASALPVELQEVVDASPNIIHATIAKPTESYQHDLQNHTEAVYVEKTASDESLELPIDL